MPTPRFIPLTLAEFEELAARYTFSRRITALHMHHTWRPRHRDYAGHATIVGMWRYHTQEKGWSDIAQHATIAPDGTIWTGRSWDLPPASSVGHNGNSLAGPFMFEIIGDFDAGQDRLEGKQRESVIGVIVAIQRRHGLGPETLRFHRDLGSPKTCPGQGIEFAGFVEACRGAHAAAPASTRRRAVRGRGAAARKDEERSPFGDAEDAVASAMLAMRERARAKLSAESAEDDHAEGMRAARIEWDGGGVERAPVAVRGGDAPLDPAMFGLLRRHVVNLTQGVFSSSGIFQTSRADVDAMFDEHMTQALDQAKQAGHPLRLVIFAHGGLVSEAAGLGIAARQVDWWRRNGVYPIHFVWETGLGPTIAQLLKQAAARMPGALSRDPFDWTSDPLVEVAARALGGEKVWGGMKWSASRASEPGGGARYVAERLARFCGAHGASVQVHAVGHSAGSIFHSHFVPAALTAGVARFETLQLLAPAVRLDSFLERLGPQVGKGNAIAALTMYTMARDWERRDSVAGIYRKSLLYLVSRALEPNGETPILGLEESVRDNAACRALFGLGTPAAGAATVVWSKSEASEGRHASRSSTHGGFDEDVPTMHSIVRRVLGVGDLDSIEAFTPDARSRSLDEDAWPPELQWVTRVGGAPSAAAAVSPGVADEASPATAPGGPLEGTGARVALCVGIDEYASAPLEGCVNDATRWKRTLERAGFTDVQLLTNGEATRDGMLAALDKLIQGRRPGDVVVFQYSGHGTHLPDVDGDEDDSEDEALCPVDLDQGRFLIDDDLREVLTRVPDGVNLTCFFDCCHSGTVTRLVRPGPVAAAAGVRGGPARKRYLRATDAMIDAHRAFRKGRPVGRGRSGRRALGGVLPDMREMVFTACRADQVAFESDGQGDFTRLVTELLSDRVPDESYAEFHARILRAFGSGARQEPQLNCADASRALRLLRPF
ncbi:MAG TPA: caspase family protein [Methylomirabilota bacterium]|nr:caspase family protein [Methylomirabilota bacterium]